MIRLRMPFDVESMLSSSPPGFELNLDIRSDFVKDEEDRKQLQFATKARWYAVDRRVEEPGQNATSESLQRRGGWLDEDTSRRISNWESYYDCDDNDSVLDSSIEQQQPAARGLTRKVSFADRLQSVLVIEETPDDPPWTLCRNAAALDDDGGSSDDIVVPDEPRLVPDFTQLAADYLAFRNAVETRFVSLVNVVVKNYAVFGTVRVKNVAFEKRVVVRHSFDDWLTHHDVVGTHQADQDERFDTFAFHIDCPPNLAPGVGLQFAVLYIVNGAEYWDNNRGSNYHLTYVSGGNPVAGRFRSPGAEFSGTSSYLWSEYSGWSNVQAESPYW